MSTFRRPSGRSTASSKTASVSIGGDETDSAPTVAIEQTLGLGLKERIASTKWLVWQNCSIKAKQLLHNFQFAKQRDVQAMAEYILSLGGSQYLAVGDLTSRPGESAHSSKSTTLS
jgi:hypothetical protein